MASVRCPSFPSNFRVCLPFIADSNVLCTGQCVASFSTNFRCDCCKVVFAPGLPVTVSINSTEGAPCIKCCESENFSYYLI